MATQYVCPLTKPYIHFGFIFERIKIHSRKTVARHLSCHYEHARFGGKKRQRKLFGRNDFSIMRAGLSSHRFLVDGLSWKLDTPALVAILPCQHKKKRNNTIRLWNACLIANQFKWPHIFYGSD